MSDGNSTQLQPAATGRQTGRAPASPRHSRSVIPLMIGFSVVVVFFLTSSLVGYLKIQTLRDNSRMVVHTHDVMEALGDIISLTTDAETGQRGYLLTGSESYLEPYRAAVTPDKMAARNAA